MKLQIKDYVTFGMCLLCPFFIGPFAIIAVPLIMTHWYIKKRHDKERREKEKRKERADETRRNLKYGIRRYL